MITVQYQFDKELKIDEKKIFSTKLKDEDIGDLVIQNQNASITDHQNIEIIEKLRHILKKPMQVPIELTNLLQADLEQKKRLK